MSEENSAPIFDQGGKSKNAQVNFDRGGASKSCDRIVDTCTIDGAQVIFYELTALNIFGQMPGFYYRMPDDDDAVSKDLAISGPFDTYDEAFADASEFIAECDETPLTLSVEGDVTIFRDIDGRERVRLENGSITIIPVPIDTVKLSEAA